MVLLSHPPSYSWQRDDVLEPATDLRFLAAPGMPVRLTCPSELGAAEIDVVISFLRFQRDILFPASRIPPPPDAVD